MDTSVLKSFAQESRRYLMDVVAKKIEYYLTSDNVEIRANKHLIEELKKDISNSSKDQVIEKIAYTWFNRFCALRYMDVKQYSLVGVLTPVSESHTQPEILMEAKSGHIKDELGNPASRDHVIGLLSGKVSTNDPQSEAYKHLVLMACNYYHSIMPFLFEKIDDYTELLMPDDLLSEASIISKVRSALNEENCKDVEVIGWLYQFYISEKKDEVFEGLKKNKKITPENIPAATQLFTPSWIVRYLVENSLGRLWMLNRPNSNLISKMEYYIKPETEEKDFLRIKGPEEIKVCDPACGSGHMLVYAFDLLYLMYEEEGIDSNEIPSLIISKNLFGIEIDRRAGELAAFALTMKAREKQRRYFRNPVSPNVCVLENIHFEETEIKDYMDHVGHDLFSSQLRSTLTQFEDAKNFGSLIKPELTDVENILSLLDQKNVSGHLFLTQTHTKVLNVLSQAKLLSPIYHVVIANPPYMGSKGMNGRLGTWAKDNYPNSKSDLFAMFIERNLELAQGHGMIAMITMQSWMFLSSFESLRARLLGQETLLSMAHLGTRSFDSIGGEVVSTTAFVLENTNRLEYKGGYLRLVDGNSEAEKDKAIREAIKNPSSDGFYRASAADFKKIPGSPIAYWATDNVFEIFKKCKGLRELVTIKQGMATSNNDRFLRSWYEVSFSKIAFDCNSLEESIERHEKWYPYNKGGAFRKWFGNNELVVNWKNNGAELKEFQSTLNQGWTARLKSREYYFKPSITWTDVSSSSFGVRFSKPGFIFDVSGSSAFPDERSIYYYTALLCSKVSHYFLKLVNPTLHFQVENIAIIPTADSVDSKTFNEISNVAQRCVNLSEADWNTKETSWDFKTNKFVLKKISDKCLENIFSKIVTEEANTLETFSMLEMKNNELFINLYGLNNELTPKVELDETTIHANPYYKFGISRSSSDLFALQKMEGIVELISYAVGCMFGRYSLDIPGLILANHGETVNDYFNLIPKPAFLPDEDNVIPVLDSDWFSDDISERFCKFLKVTFGEEHYAENLKFIEEAIGKDIRKYFAKDFYNDHVKIYKKRPIYWMFSSPKGTFNALIYMHRYTSDTVSIVLNSYLREFRTKLNSKLENLERLSVAEATSTKDKTAALKEIEQLKKMIVELDEYEKDILYPLATQRLEIDLDDGVKSNYPKFGKALKPIKGLDKGED